MRYIILKNKKATCNFKDEKNLIDESIQHLFKDLGIVVPNGYVVVDFDSFATANKVLEIIKQYKIKTRVIATNRGIHCYFKNTDNKVNKNHIKSICTIGLECDYKLGGNSYVCVKQNGVFRNELMSCDFDDMDEIPMFFIPKGVKNYNLLGLEDGDGRNDKLFRYTGALYMKGFSIEDIEKITECINNYVFNEPLEDEELSLILRKSNFENLKEVKTNENQHILLKAETQEDKKFNHAEFAETMLQHFDIKVYNGSLYVYKDNRYVNDVAYIEYLMLTMWQGIKKRQRIEVLEYLRILQDIYITDVDENIYRLNTRECFIDIRNDKTFPHTNEIFETRLLDVKFDKNAKCDEVDVILNNVFLENQNLINLFCEMLGYILLNSNKYRKGFMLLGGGKNGKSTVLNMIKNFLGRDNYSVLGLDDLSDRFRPAEIENKFANIGDDINNIPIKKSGDLKKIFTGESIVIERKNQKPYRAELKAKMIFSMNEIPKNADKTEGFYSRLMFIPFNANFDNSRADFDPYIEDKVKTDKAKSYLLNLALKGIKRVIKQNGFTNCKESEEILQNFKISNNNILMWIEEEEINSDTIINLKCTDLWNDYYSCCRVNNTEPYGRREFYQFICTFFGVKRIVKKINGQCIRGFSQN